MKTYNWIKFLDEFDTCVKLIAVWVILKGGEVAGRVITRYSKTGATTYVIFQMFGWASTSGSAEKVYGYERMTGWGYNRSTTGIGEILDANRERLKEDYGIDLKGAYWEIANTWEKDFENAGYKVIRAI